MTTPLIMVLILALPAAAARLRALLAGRAVDVSTPAALGLGFLFVFTGVGHFIQTAAMAQMLPPWVPFRVPLVYATGVLEFAIAGGLLARRWRYYAGWAAAAALIAFFPANIYAAFNHVGMGGHEWGPVYLLIRAPLQALILAWTYWFILRHGSTALRLTLP